MEKSDFQKFIQEGYNDSPKGSRDTSEQNPVVVVYDDEFRKGKPGISGNMNLTTFMNIHGISAKYQKELAKMVLKAGKGKKVELSDKHLKDYNAEYEKEGKDTRRVWIELNLITESEIESYEQELMESFGASSVEGAMRKALRKKENWNKDGSINWNYVDADVYMDIKPMKDNRKFYYDTFDKLADKFDRMLKAGKLKEGFTGDKKFTDILKEGSIRDKKSYEAGKKAALDGVKYEDNPNTKGSQAYLDWSKGHNAARAKKLNIREDLETTELTEAKEHPAYKDLMDLAKIMGKSGDSDTRAIQVMAGKIANFTATGNRGILADLGKAFKALDSNPRDAFISVMQKHDKALLKSIAAKAGFSIKE